MINKPTESTDIIARVKLPDKYIFEIKAKIIHIMGKQIEPERKKGELGNYIYNEGERPDHTYVVYILQKTLLEQIAKRYNKITQSLHIHECVNSKGDVICWPQQILNKNDAINLLKNWAGLISSLFVSEKTDINDFYSADDPNWVENTIKSHQIEIKIDRI